VPSRARSRPPQVAFVYPNPRAELAAQVARGEAPDSTLLGQNHLAALGFDARVYDPALTRRGGGRVRWNLREVTLPWELGDAEVHFTPLAGLFPLAAPRAAGRASSSSTPTRHFAERITPILRTAR
jgi:hypothetical protein